MVGVPTRRIGREANVYAYERMLAAAQDPGVSPNRARKVLRRGRNRLLMLARRLGRQDPAGMDPSRREQYDADLALLVQMCQAQFVLRRQVLERRGADLSEWAAEPDYQRLPGSAPDLISRANRLAAVSGDADEVGRQLAELVRIAGIGPFLRW